MASAAPLFVLRPVAGVTNLFCDGTVRVTSNRGRMHVDVVRGNGHFHVEFERGQEAAALNVLAEKCGDRALAEEAFSHG